MRHLRNLYGTLSVQQDVFDTVVRPSSGQKWSACSTYETCWRRPALTR